MKLALALVLGLAAMTSFASDLVKIKDGTTFDCKTTVDVALSRYGVAYKPSIISQSKTDIVIGVRFVSCSQSRDGEFGFSTDTSVGFKRSTMRDEVLTFSRSGFKLVVTNIAGNLLETKELEEISPGMYYAKISYNDRVDISVASKIKIQNETRSQIVYQGIDGLGTFRVVSE